MSAPHDDAHAHAAAEQPEVTHPLIWFAFMVAISVFLVWLFFSFLASGRVQGRVEGAIRMPEAAGGEVEPDHAKLIADRSQDVLDKGSVVYGKNCASCHGPQGNSNPTNMNPPPRNFRTEAFKNQFGGGPYALYCVLSHGLNGMPAFPGLSPEQRYAVIHFIRETWVKTDNAKNYLANDVEAVARNIPPPGKAVAEGAASPAEVEIKAPVRPLLAAIADEQSVAWNDTAAWLYAALRTSAGQAEVRAGVTHLAELFNDQALLVEQVRQTVTAGDKEHFASLLAGSDGSGAVRPYFSLLADDQLLLLFQFLKNQGAR